MVFKSTVKYLNNISNGLENAVQERMKSERMKAELITNVSHDIKTPLTSIINYVDLLKKEDIANEKANEYINILDNKSQRLKKLTEDLIEASKVSTGNVSLNLEKINIVELIKQAIGEFEDKFQNKNLQIIVNCNENEININADSRYMYRIVENLFSNIYKYALEKYNSEFIFVVGYAATKRPFYHMRDENGVLQGYNSFSVTLGNGLVGTITSLSNNSFILSEYFSFTFLSPAISKSSSRLITSSYESIYENSKSNEVNSVACLFVFEFSALNAGATSNILDIPAAIAICL